jgi:hypothetical protein
MRKSWLGCELSGANRDPQLFPRRDLERLKESVVPIQPPSQQIFFVRYDDETDAQL